MADKPKRVILIKATGDEEVIFPQVKPTLKQMQEWVGGYIEPIKVKYNGHIATMVVNEEGLIHGLPTNFKASRIACGRLIVGNVFILEGWRI